MLTGSSRSAPASPAWRRDGIAIDRYAIPGDQDGAGELAALVQPDEHPPYRLRLAALSCRRVDRLCQGDTAGSTKREEEMHSREGHHSLTNRVAGPEASACSSWTEPQVNGWPLRRPRRYYREPRRVTGDFRRVLREENATIRPIVARYGNNTYEDQTLARSHCPSVGHRGPGGRTPARYAAGVGDNRARNESAAFSRAQATCVAGHPSRE